MASGSIAPGARGLRPFETLDPRKPCSHLRQLRAPRRVAAGRLAPRTLLLNPYPCTLQSPAPTCVSCAYCAVLPPDNGSPGVPLPTELALALRTCRVSGVAGIESLGSESPGLRAGWWYGEAVTSAAVPRSDSGDAMSVAGLPASPASVPAPAAQRDCQRQHEYVHEGSIWPCVHGLEA